MTKFANAIDKALHMIELEPLKGFVIPPREELEKFLYKYHHPTALGLKGLTFIAHAFIVGYNANREEESE